MNWIEMLNTLEATPKGKARNTKLAEFLSMDGELADVLVYSLDPNYTFGVQVIPELPPRGEDEGLYLSFREIREVLLDRLASRDLSGGAAETAIIATLSMVSPDAEKWLRRIIPQKLNLGIGAKTVNKIQPGLIYEFPVSLAEKLKDAKPHHLIGRWIAQPKADGGRAVAILPPKGGEVIMRSRTGHKWRNFESVRLELQAFNTIRNGNETLYLDGEVVSYLDGVINFQAVQKTMLATERATEVGELKFLVFDGCVGSEEWENPKKTYEERYEIASRIVATSGLHKTEMLPVVTVLAHPSPDFLWELHNKMVEERWEGLMIRRMDIPPSLKRSFDLIKLKQFFDDEAEIIGWEPGKPGTQYEGQIGAFLCRHKDGTEFGCGSGLTNDIRASDPESFMGRLINYTFFERTDDNNPRHPVFKYFRAHEDTDTEV